MRIGLIIYGSLDTQSGGYLYDRKLVEFLRSQGDDVAIVSLPWRNYAQHITQNFSPMIRHGFESYPVDLWLQDELNHPSLFWANQWLRRRRQTPLISIVHHLRSSEEHPASVMWLYRKVERTYLNTLDGFVFNSQTTRSVVEGMIGRPTGGVVATPAGDRFGGLDRAAIEKRCAQSGPLRLLFVGNLIPRKGLHRLIAGLAQIRAEDWILDVIGRVDIAPAYVHQIRSLIQQYGLAERICLRGSISDDELAAALAQAQVFTMLSSYEGFGIVYLEAMRYGLPAVAATRGAAWEIVAEGSSGRLFEPGDAAGLAAAIQTYCCDRNILSAHSHEARRRFDSFPTWEETGQKIRDYLCGVAAGVTDG